MSSQLRPHASRVVRRDVHPVRLDAQAVILLARLAHGGRVHERHELERFAHERAIKRLRARALELAQVDVALERVRDRAERLHGAAHARHRVVASRARE